MSRTRWAYTLDGVALPEPVQVSEDYSGGSQRSAVLSDAFMDGARSPLDGTDIGSRTKRRAYMKARGLADAADYRGEWKKAEEHRHAIQTGTVDRNERRAEVARALETQR